MKVLAILMFLAPIVARADTINLYGGPTSLANSYDWGVEYSWFAGFNPKWFGIAGIISETTIGQDFHFTSFQVMPKVEYVSNRSSHLWLGFAYGPELENNGNTYKRLTTVTVLGPRIGADFPLAGPFTFGLQVSQTYSTFGVYAKRQNASFRLGLSF